MTLAEFVAAFYTTWPFRLERWILRLLLGLRSTDAEARELARGERGVFAAWNVEASSLGPVHGRLIGFHRLYSRLLLQTAVRRLRARPLP